MVKFIQSVSILISTWNNLPYLKKCVEYIKKYSKEDYEIVISVDGPHEPTEKWLSDQKGINYVVLDKHRGISDTINEGIKRCTKEYVLILHDDVLVAPNYDINLEPHISPKNILTMQFIEPGNNQVSPFLVESNCGKDLESFKEDLFLKRVKQHSKDEVTLGVNWAPLINKKLFLEVGGLNPIFNKSTCSDTDLWYKLANKGCKFLRVLNSMCYHFQGKAQASKGEEYKKDEVRSIRDFVRIWGEPFVIGTDYRYTFGSDCKPGVNFPTINFDKNNNDNFKVSLVILTHNDEDKIFNLLLTIEPLFDEVIIVDDCSKDGTQREIKRYIEEESKSSLLFKKDKVQIHIKKLKGDFSEQRNYANSKCTGDWIFEMDSDEQLDLILYQNFRKLLQQYNKNKDIQVIGVPRVNLIDGVKTKVFPDYQFRIHRKGIEWVGNVHEVPKPVYESITKNMNKGNIGFLQGMGLVHPKTSQKQQSQNDFYRKLIKSKRGKINKIIYDSVIYTLEGITEHARQEVIELNKRGYQMWLINDLPRNLDKFPSELLKMYQPWDINNNDYFTIINQPPPRWNRSLFLRNSFGYLAFEGNLPDDWVKTINQSPILELWTPSEYCKKRFIDSGVNKNVRVIPHGVDPKVWKPMDTKKFDKFTFLFCGTTHNKRKGYDLAIKTFSETFKENPNVQLILKVNKIYNQKQDIDSLISRYVVEGGNDNIYVIEDDLSTEDLVKLFNQSHVYLSPHYCEGFGINILNALACGIPVIATRGSGNMDFCNDDNCTLIDVEDKLIWAPFEYPYLNSKWFKPKESSLSNRMIHVFNNYKEYSKLTLDNSKSIREEHSWEKVADKIEKALNEY